MHQCFQVLSASVRKFLGTFSGSTVDCKLLRSSEFFLDFDSQGGYNCAQKPGIGCPDGFRSVIRERVLLKARQGSDWWSSSFVIVVQFLLSGRVWAWLIRLQHFEKNFERCNDPITASLSTVFRMCYCNYSGIRDCMQCWMPIARHFIVTPPLRDKTRLAPTKNLRLRSSEKDTHTAHTVRILHTKSVWTVFPPQNFLVEELLEEKNENLRISGKNENDNFYGQFLFFLLFCRFFHQFILRVLQKYETHSMKNENNGIVIFTILFIAAFPLRSIR